MGFRMDEKRLHPSDGTRLTPPSLLEESAWRRNLEALWDLLSCRPADTILGHPEILLKAEIYRALGDFHEARRLLSTLEATPLTEVSNTRETMEQLSRVGIRAVSAVHTWTPHLLEAVSPFAEEWLEPGTGHVYTYEIEGAYRAWVAGNREHDPVSLEDLFEGLKVFGYATGGSIRVYRARLRRPVPPDFHVFTPEWRDSFRIWSEKRAASGEA